MLPRVEPTWLGVDDAATRLGVKPATLYAYVSRGVLTRRRSPEGRSLFDPAEVERLARRGRPRRVRASSELVVESQITSLGEDRPYYRGRDALELARTWEFEDVAHWLWTGRTGGTPVWRAAPEAVAAGRAAQAGLPPEVLPLERLQVVTPALAATDPMRLNLDPEAVVLVGQNLIAGMVDCLPGESSSGPIADRIWAKLSRRAPEPGLVDALRTALVLLADHELAASTLAARVAASVKADPYAVVTTGLGVVGGALHGGASLSAEAMLAEAGEPVQAQHAVGRRLRRGDRIPGLGHTVYKSRDRRASTLLECIRTAAPDHEKLAVADALLADAARRRLPGPNVEFSLAVLVAVAGMVGGAGEAIFAIARTAGWLAHAIEEYARATPVRLRAVYTGPLPAPTAMS
jgi:citrate synthase